jgi:hypothetical protein
MDSFWCEDDLDEEKAKRSILVSNVPEHIWNKDVVIHFQRERNGGGYVDSCMYVDKEDRSSVIITFDKPSSKIIIHSY